MLPPQEALATEPWLLTHEDLRRAARIAALMDFLAGDLKRQEAQLMGAAGDESALSQSVLFR